MNRNARSAHSLHLVFLGALIAGLIAGSVETWIHCRAWPETASHFPAMVAIASLVDHSLALVFGLLAWALLYPVARMLNSPNRGAWVMAAQSVGLLSLGVLYWYNDVKLAAPLLARSSLKADAIVLSLSLVLWLLVAFAVRWTGVARLSRRMALIPYALGIVLLSGMAWVSSGFSSARENDGREMPNLVLISLDTLRADHLSTYGYQRDTDPRIVHMAENGVVFDQAFTPAPSSAPGHAAMLTGMHPLSTGVAMNGQCLPEEAITLAEHLRERGYRTAGFAQNPWLTSTLGLAQGFQTFFNDRRLERADEIWPRACFLNTMLLRVWDRLNDSSDPTTPLATDWMAQGQPFFLFYHLIDVHQPYNPSRAGKGRFRDPHYKGKVRDTQAAANMYNADPTTLDAEDLAYLEDRYDESVSSADAKVGRLLANIKAQGLERETLVVLVADHGEHLSKHMPSFGHEDLHAATLHIPWIFYWPGKLSPHHVAAPVQLPDLVPTICGMLGIVPPVTSRGHRFEESQASAAPLVSIDVTENHERRALRTEQWNLIRGDVPPFVELFDLTKDPEELVNVADQHPTVVEQLSAMLDSLATNLSSGALTSELKIDQLDEGARRRLQALGYL